MRVGMALVLVALVAASAEAETKGAPPAAAVVAPPATGAKVRPVKLSRLGSSLSPEQEIGASGVNIFTCAIPSSIHWRHITTDLSNLGGIFSEVLQKAGFNPSSPAGDLFAAKEPSATDLEVGAFIKGAEASYCRGLANDTVRLKLTVQWQVYSNLQRAVVATIETEGSAEQHKGPLVRSADHSIGQDAFAANVRALLNDEKFRGIVTAPDPAAPGPPTAIASREPIQLQGPAPRAVPISDALGSVASIFAGDGFGSGVLVSSDGYMLTDAHVVGGASHVRVRWSDGFETTGEVVRSDKRRDVALIRTDSHGREPLPIRRGAPQIGSTVYAIGTPLDPKLQSTVTKGIVSANRIMDGFSFIQSDVAVNHGNSGGPLLDESGAVIGLTDWGMQPEGDNSHNFFTPVGDALDFLNLKLADAPPAIAAAAASAKKAVRRK